jgi:hypothetical protein
MKILTKLTAVSADAPDPAPAIRQGMNLEPVPGFWLNVAISDNGLFIRTNKDTVFVPIDELLGLAQTHHPALKPPAKKGK